MEPSMEWLERHANQKAAPNERSSVMENLFARLTASCAARAGFEQALVSSPSKYQTVVEKLNDDQERGLYTFFDYMNTVINLPHEVLSTVTNMPEAQRREFCRYLCADNTHRASPRIWKKVTFVDSGEKE